MTVAAEVRRAGRPDGVFWSALSLIAVVDVVTKYVAHTALASSPWPREVLGDVVRLRLLYNPGAAFGLNVGPHSRWFFLVLTAGALVVLGRMYLNTPPGDRARALALGLVCGGAFGNLVNRLWSPRGVVDFIDVGVGDWRWPSFNVADIGVSIGALLLARVLWQKDRQRAQTGAPPGANRPPEDR